MSFTPVQAHFAVNKGSVDDIRQLIEQNIDLNYCIYGNTPLLLAISKEHEYIAELLAETQYCDISLPEESEWHRYPIHLAARSGYTKVVQTILSRGGDINIRDALDMTPLHWAAVGGHEDTVQCLLNHGADVSVVDISLRTPLNRAAEHCHMAIISQLHQAGVDINHQDKYGWSVLFHSVTCGHTDVIHTLVDCDVDVNIQCDSGETVLHIATHRLRHAVLHRLQCGSDINVYSRNVEMPTSAVHEAINKTVDDIDTVHLLLQYGANVNVFNKNGQAPICLAAIIGREDMMRLMIECGVFVYQHSVQNDLKYLSEQDIENALGAPLLAHCIENCCDFLLENTPPRMLLLSHMCRLSIRKAMLKPINTHVSQIHSQSRFLERYISLKISVHQGLGSNIRKKF